MEQLRVKIFNDELPIIEASNIQLEYFATTTLRTFYFQEVIFLSENLTLMSGDAIRVFIYFIDDKLDETECVVEYFEMRLGYINDDHQLKCHPNITSLKLKGAVLDEADYSQGEINIYNCWASNKEIEWWNLPSDISILDYAHVCLRYTGIAENKPKKNIVEVNFKHIKSELEFSCAFAEAYLGKRAYMGRYLDTFEDCLLTLYNSDNSYFNDVFVILIHKELSINNSMRKIIQDIISILKRYKFNIIEK